MYDFHPFQNNRFNWCLVIMMLFLLVMCERKILFHPCYKYFDLHIQQESREVEFFNFCMQLIVHTCIFSQINLKAILLRLQNFCCQPLTCTKILESAVSAIWMSLSFIKIPQSGIFLALAAWIHHLTFSFYSTCCHSFKKPSLFF